MTKVKNTKSTLTDTTLDNDVAVKITTLVVEPIVPGEKLNFKKLQHLSDMLERHLDALSTAEQKAQAADILKKITELNITRLTQDLNDVEKSQAAMLIRYIIKNHPQLEKILLEHNTFSPPDLQFIINALIFVKHDTSKKYSVREVNLTQAVHPENIERSSSELRHLKKSYGSTINLDSYVYEHFIENYKAACDNYVKYLAEKIIIPKTKTAVTGHPIEFTDKIALEVTSKGGKPTAKADIKFAAAVKKYQHIRDLQKIVYRNATAQQLFDEFEKHYASIKKQISTPLNKEESTHQERFHGHVGEIEFINTSLAGKNVSIFKKPPTKKKKRAKAKSKSKAKAKTKTAAKVPSV